MRKKIYNILNQNAIYDTFMFAVIIIEHYSIGFC